MKKSYVLIFILFFLTQQVFGQERTNREKLSFVTSSENKLSKATGWAYNTALGEWVDYENVISDDKDFKVKYKSLQGSYMMSHSSQNFQWLWTRTISFKGTLYYVLILEKWSGAYQYPSIQEDWYQFIETIAYVYTKEEYQKLFNIESSIELKTKCKVSMGSKYEKYDETIFLDLIQTELSKVESAYSPEYTFPIRKSKEGAIRFYIPEYFSTYSKYDFEKKYFETDSETFANMILK
jgi:hypothetical protein